MKTAEEKTPAEPLPSVGSRGESGMKVNIHTHTARCRHAVGSEREYVENAIAAGIQVLGFSDHVPYPFPGAYRSGVRMAVEETEGYVKTLAALREEYKKDIQILIGYEAEYYPRCFSAMMDLVLSYECDYLIMGQHFSENEFDGRYATKGGDDEQLLVRYTDQVIEGMKTGVFTYLCHPDMYRFDGDLSVYRREAKRICLAAKELNLPLEINLLGIDDKRHYPREDFWEAAKEVGNPVFFGSDAHSPDVVYRKEAMHTGRALAAKYGLTVIESPKLKDPREAYAVYKAKHPAK